jgi:hypothetical protein
MSGIATGRSTTANRPDSLWRRVAARGAAAVIAVVAGAASFEHIASVAAGAGERAWVAYSLPLAIDGLIVVGVTALLEDQGSGRQGRLSARLAVLVGVAATLAANVASAEPTWTGRLVALAAPVSFLLSVEVLTRTGRKLSTPDDNNSTGDYPAGAGEAGPATPATAPTRTPAKRTAAPRRRPNTAQRVGKAVAETPTATAAEIAARLKVSERTVQRYWPDPAGDSPATANGSGGKSRPGVAPVPAAAFDRPTSRNSSDRAPASA